MAKVKFDPQSVIDEQITNIDAAIEAIEKRIRPYDELAARKHQLLAARRALLGGNRLTGTGGHRLTLDDVVGFVKTNPGCIPQAIAQHFGVSQTTVSSHLYRNKGRFINKEGRYWARDPEAGLNDEHDLPGEALR